MRAQQRPFTVERAKLPAKASAEPAGGKEARVVGADRGELIRDDAEQKRERRIKAIAINAFRNWRPGL